ncbi:hypothetical protein SAMN05428975_3991 [Mucilaginibacter sp. OK268]|uniref:hypothetical protein n=1 Tax=Mucilaginibacter sp. OK268 TaxID=1881048 RepID=UPI000884A337|nr:hypothetical protein [Mucilaginibacter sp. OK268]SDP94763.1 hypothetical protein SAMN05428975_3991 [Mucilaginibacter sp. OK268]
MKRALLLTLTVLIGTHFANAQTKTVTVDANDALNNNTKIVAQTSIGQIFFTGHQLGTSYAYPSAGIFRAWTDNPNGANNIFFDGITAGTTNFSVRADGQGYFAGNVGISTNAPAAKLHIFSQYDVNQITALKMFYQGTWGTPTYATNFRFIDLNSTESGKVLQVNGTGIGIGYDPPAWSTADKLYINGNVGIGTTDPKGYKLAVNGSAIATAMIVKLNSAWPDYVFKKDYQLPSLQEVKAYIDQNQHLPEIPSEQQITKEGLNLGEMNKLLMKKVEELTLYLIDEHKKNKDQQEQIDQLNKRIELLNNKIE